MHLDAFNEFIKHSNRINESVRCPNLTDAKRRCFILRITHKCDRHSVSQSFSQPASEPASPAFAREHSTVCENKGINYKL